MRVTGLGVLPVRNGLGIVTTRAFARDGLICRLRGRIVPFTRVWRYWETDRRRAENCFRYDAERYLDPEGEIGAFANHSCAPNAGIFKSSRGLTMHALRPLAPGEEVTHDYSTLLGADDIWRMRCNCGEPQCRKVVASYRSLPDAVLRRYLRLGIIPAFILETGG